jgi:hypothetical protein
MNLCVQFFNYILELLRRCSIFHFLYIISTLIQYCSKSIIANPFIFINTLRPVGKSVLIDPEVMEQDAQQLRCYYSINNNNYSGSLIYLYIDILILFYQFKMYSAISNPHTNITKQCLLKQQKDLSSNLY